jgi:hypothetical protein
MNNISFFFFLIVVLGFEIKVLYHLSHATSSFCPWFSCYFSGRVWLSPHPHPRVGLKQWSSHVAGITGVSHHAWLTLASFCFETQFKYPVLCSYCFWLFTHVSLVNWLLELSIFSCSKNQPQTLAYTNQDFFHGGDGYANYPDLLLKHCIHVLKYHTKLNK